MLAWQRLLNLADWRIVFNPKDTKALSEVYDFSDNDKLVRYRIGSNWGMNPVDEDSLEETAIHELLHVRLRPLIRAVADHGEDSDLVAEKEHEIIVVLSPLLQKLSKVSRGIE